MKKLLLATVFVALPFGAHAADIGGSYAFIQDSAPEPAPSVVGHLELSLGWEQFKDDETSDEDDFGRFEGRGRVNVPFAGNWNLEIETGGVALFDSDGGSGSGIGVFGHLWADFAGFRVGPFGGIDFLNFGELGTAGLEAEVDVGNLTLGAQGSYTQQLDCGTCWYWAVTGWADLYVTPDTKLGVEARYLEAEGGSDGWSVTGTAEQRFAGTPISVFARASYADMSNVAEAVSVLGGVRIFMDGGLTLEEHDKQVPFTFEQAEFVNYFNYRGGAED